MSAREELRENATSAKDAEHEMDRIARSANANQQEQMKLTTEKSKLEAQVRELQAELRRQQFTSPPSMKSATRPRTSSLTNLKVATLENDLQQIRASASSSQIELNSTRSKLAKMQTDLVRVENEKAVLEKRLVEKDQRLQEVIQEKEEMTSEVDYLREHNDSAEREQQLLARIEEEEAKVAILEKGLAQVQHSKDMQRSISKLKDLLDTETVKRRNVEAREVGLVQEKEEALNELANERTHVQQLNGMLQVKDLRIKELEKLERYALLCPFYHTRILTISILVIYMINNRQRKLSLS